MLSMSCEASSYTIKWANDLFGKKLVRSQVLEIHGRYQFKHLLTFSEQVQVPVPLVIPYAKYCQNIEQYHSLKTFPEIKIAF